MSTMPDGQIQAAADAKASTMHHTPVKPMERVVSPEDIERGERMERRRSAEPGFWRFLPSSTPVLSLRPLPSLHLRLPITLRLAALRAFRSFCLRWYRHFPWASSCGSSTSSWWFWDSYSLSAGRFSGASLPLLRFRHTFRSSSSAFLRRFR